MPSKPLWKSKIFWFNVLTATAEVLQLLSGTRLVAPDTMVLAAGAVNIGLRIVTTDSVHLTRPAPPPETD